MNLIFQLATTNRSYFLPRKVLACVRIYNIDQIQNVLYANWLRAMEDGFHLGCYHTYRRRIGLSRSENAWHFVRFAFNAPAYTYRLSHRLKPIPLWYVWLITHLHASYNNFYILPFKKLTIFLPSLVIVQVRSDMSFILTSFPLWNAARVITP